MGRSEGGQPASQDIELMETVRKKQQAFTLRVKESWSWADISSALEVNETTARRWVREMGVIWLPYEELEEVREQNVFKIDEDERRANTMLSMLAQQADQYRQENKDISRTLEEIRKWHERRESLRRERALLLGLNKPVKVEHLHKVKTDFDQEIEDLVASLSGGGMLQTQPEDIWESE